MKGRIHAFLVVPANVVPAVGAALYAQTDADRCTALNRVSIPDVEITSAVLTQRGRWVAAAPSPSIAWFAAQSTSAIGFGGKPFAIGFEMRLP